MGAEVSHVQHKIRIGDDSHILLAAPSSFDGHVVAMLALLELRIVHPLLDLVSLGLCGQQEGNAHIVNR